MVTKICVSYKCLEERRNSQKKNSYVVYTRAFKEVAKEVMNCPDCGSPLSERKQVTNRKVKDRGKLF